MHELVQSYRQPMRHIIIPNFRGGNLSSQRERVKCSISVSKVIYPEVPQDIQLARVLQFLHHPQTTSMYSVNLSPMG